MRKAYTLVELLIGLSIVALVFSFSSFSYREFTRRQIIISAARQLEADLRLAQTESLAGKKPAGCNGLLSGYLFARLSQSQYRVSAQCVNSSVVIRDVSLPQGVILNNFSSFTFKTLGDGTTLPQGGTVSIILSIPGISYTDTVVVSASGDIQ